MADHVRQQIREQVAATITGLTTTGTNVHQDRLYALSNMALPALNVYAKSERSEYDVMGADYGVERRLDLIVEGYARANTDLEDTLDTIAKEVEIAIAADRDVNGLARDIMLTATELTTIGEGDTIAGVIVLEFMVEYVTQGGAPDVVD